MSNPAIGALRQSGNLFALGLDTLRALPRRPFQTKEFIQQSWFVASVTILPTALVSIPFGAVIALQLGNLTRQLGAQSFTGSASVLAVIREASPIVTALLIAGAGGSAICADLGARKIREEIDAMQVLGIDPIQRLVVPRVLAMMLVAVLLNGLVSVVGVGRRLLLQRRPAGRYAGCLPGVLHRAGPAARTCTSASSRRSCSVPSRPSSRPTRGSTPAVVPRAWVMPSTSRSSSPSCCCSSSTSS